MSDRAKILRAIKKCLSDALTNFQETMLTLDEMSKTSTSAAVSTFIFGGNLMKIDEKEYRKALISLDAAERALLPLAKRIRDGRVNTSHFTDENAIILLRDVIDFEYQILVNLLFERKSRESVWYRLRELSEKVEKAIELIAES
jgi:hypothetical protein